MPDNGARLVDLSSGLYPDQDNHGCNGCNRRSRVHCDAELTMVRIAFDRVEVGHLHHDQQSQQGQTQ
jgi:hypothetical protein